MVQKEVDEKISAHQKWNQNHVDLTREPLSSVHILNQDSGFRYATPQYLHTPPPSDSSDMADNPPTFPEEEHEMDVDAGAGEEAWELQGARSYRRRVGRLGRIWIDRRGPPSPYESSDEPASDRWKYDYDDDDEPQVYEIDTNDIRSIKFRATIPTSSSFIARRSQHDIPNAGGSAVAGSPLARPIPPATQNAPT
jgi:enhancer of polycomb-like protein